MTSFLFLASDILVSKFKRLSEADEAISPAKYTFVEDNTVFRTEGATLRLDHSYLLKISIVIKAFHRGHHGINGHDHIMVVGFTPTCAIGPSWPWSYGGWIYNYMWNQGPSWLWSYGGWIYNYMCNQCLSPLTLCEFKSRWWWGVLDTTLCNKVCQWLATGWWFSPGTPVSSTNFLLYNTTFLLSKIFQAHFIFGFWESEYHFVTNITHIWHGSKFGPYPWNRIYYETRSTT